MTSELAAVELVDVEAVPCLGVAREAALNSLGEVFMSSVPEVDAALRAAGLEAHDDVVALYPRLERGDRSMRFELRIGRPSEADALKGLERFELPAGRVAKVMHVGSYDELADVMRALLEWCAQQGLDSQESWEVYHHSERPDDPSTYRTTACVRVEGGAG